MPDLVGQTLKNRYRVEELIGRGGMAEVYKVWDEARADHLAMKVLREDLAQDKIFVRRFEREAQTLANLQHRSIVRFFGLEQEDVLVFLLLEYVEGTSLREQIFRAKGPFSLQQVAEVLRPICAAMHFAHQMGVVHCDLKPGNILINKHGEILVTDFGIARMLDAATSTMVGIGTPAYMAPELIRGEDPTPQTDIYSLGVILYEMLSGGERPFTGERAETTGSTAERIRWEQMKLTPKSLNKFNSHINDEIHSIVFKCLEKKTANRYGDIKDVNDLFNIALLENDLSIEKQSTFGVDLDFDNQWEKGIFAEKVSIQNPLNIIGGIENDVEPGAIKNNNSNREAGVNVHETDIENNDLVVPSNIRNENDRYRNSLKDSQKSELFFHVTSYRDKIIDFDISSDKLCLFTTDGIKVFDFFKNKIISRIDIQGGCSGIRFLSSKDQISYSKGNNLYIVNIAKGGQKVSSKLIARSNIQEFDISTDGRYCVMVLEDDIIIRWDIEMDNTRDWNSIYINTSTHTRIIPGTNLFIRISGLNSIQFLSLPTLNKNSSFVGDIPFGEKNCTISRNGRYLAIWNNLLFLGVLDIENLITIPSVNEIPISIERIEEYISVISPSQLSSCICSATFTPNEEMLITFDDQGGFTVCDVSSLEKIAHQEIGIENIKKVLFSENGQYMIALSKDQRLDIWKCNWDALPQEGQQ
ncbi:MAG TPA: hypothetical protein DCK95_07740 [Anaerolineaceae bacterium]|nr:hypothetical protein [Anaerolineaceae bacterium]